MKKTTFVQLVNDLKKKRRQNIQKKPRLRLPPEQLLFKVRTEDIGNTNYQYEKLKLAEITCLVSSISGFVCALIASTFITSLDVPENSKYVTIPLILSTLNTIVLLFAIYWRAQKDLKWQQARLIYSSEDDLSTTNKINHVIIELILNSIHPIYGSQRVYIYMYNKVINDTIKYNLVSLITLLMMLRIYHIIRFVSSISKYKTSRCHRLCKIYGTPPNYWFTLKCMMKEEPAKTISCMFVSGMIIAAYAIFVFEAPVEVKGGDLGKFGNSIWCTIVTMATVGYGDYYPVTTPGRIVDFFTCIWGVLTVSLTTVTFSNLLALNHGETTSLQVLKRLWFKEKLKEQAAWVLTSAVRFKLMTKKYTMESSIVKKQFRLFRQHFMKFQYLRSQQKNLYDFDCYTDRIEMKLLEIIDVYDKTEEFQRKSNEILEFLERKDLV